MKTNLRVEQRFIVHHSCHLLYHKMTGKPVRIFMNTSLLTYAYTWQTFCTLRNGNILTYQTAHTHTQTNTKYCWYQLTNAQHWCLDIIQSHSGLGQSGIWLVAKQSQKF